MRKRAENLASIIIFRKAVVNRASVIYPVNMGNVLPFYLILLLSAVTTGLLAGAKPAEIHRLSIDLTPVGAEQAGNEDN